MSDVRIEEVDALDFRMGVGEWDFARERGADIAAHWRRRSAAQPALFNGRVLMLSRWNYETRSGARVLAGTFIETDFADFLAWRDFGFPASNACNGFSMAALRGADGAFLLGEMSPHTASAGAIYFPAGTPDPMDVVDGMVDLERSARRELFEETGVGAEEVEVAPGWLIVHGEGRVACMKPMRLRVAAAEAKAAIDARFAADPKPEFARMHVVGKPLDAPERTTGFVRTYMAEVWSREEREAARPGPFSAREPLPLAPPCP